MRLILGASSIAWVLLVAIGSTANAVPIVVDGAVLPSCRNHICTLRPTDGAFAVGEPVDGMVFSLELPDSEFIEADELTRILITYHVFVFDNSSGNATWLYSNSAVLEDETGSPVTPAFTLDGSGGISTCCEGYVGLFDNFVGDLAITDIDFHQIGFRMETTSLYDGGVWTVLIDRVEIEGDGLHYSGSPAVATPEEAALAGALVILLGD